MREVRREMVQAPDGRWCGSEIVRDSVWLGRDRGYTWSEQTVDTVVFYTEEEAWSWQADVETVQGDVAP